jgi:hypothetical protein
MRILCAGKTRKTAQNARNFGFAAQNSAKQALFGRAKTERKYSQCTSLPAPNSVFNINENEWLSI